MKLILSIIFAIWLNPFKSIELIPPQYEVFCSGNIKDKSLKVFFQLNNKPINTIKTYFGVCLYKKGVDSTFVRLLSDGMKFNCDPNCGESNSVSLYFYEEIFKQLPLGCYNVYLLDIRGYKNNIEKESNYIYKKDFFLGELIIN